MIVVGLLHILIFFFPLGFLKKKIVCGGNGSRLFEGEPQEWANIIALIRFSAR